ncbi:stress-activated map kinase-interacting protein 1 [Chironomus tepperi]|uniref:stress-activated map kinase-interacting protein 1 n=1 Tax=Chironomus tepperi TaxID=113505 RepID=UPI00391F22FB
MATFNNKHWLLTHIRNSFISTDDTGISELVMNSDDLAKNLANSYSKMKLSPGNNTVVDESVFYIYPDLINEEEDSEDLLSQSFDINFTQEGPFAFRFRTNTAAKLEKISEIRKKQSLVKTVKVDDSIIKLNQEIEDDSQLFVRKEVNTKSNEPVRSKLTEQFETLPPIQLNKYREYSIFDGSSYPSNESKTIRVYITPISELKDYPIKCCVHSIAKIEEFIGFILFKCINLYPEYVDKLEEVKNYGLFISDESGEPDLDFPALDLTESIAKYQFNILALAKQVMPHTQNRTLSVASDTTTVLIHPVNRQSSIDTNRSLPTNLRNNQNELAMNVHETMVEAPIYQAYRVYLVTKKHFRTEVQLGISAEKIEVDPLQQKSSNYFFKLKSTHFSMESVAFCEIASRKSSRFEFRIAYNPLHYDPMSFAASTSFDTTTSYSSYTLKIMTFETDPTTAEQICLKVNNILLLRTSSVRREYLSRHEKIKKSFIRKKKFPI